MGLKKNNIRSIRFSDELLEIIEQQVGRNFTEKFERLVYNCYMLSAVKEEEIKKLDSEIETRREQLARVRKEISALMPLLSSISRQLTSVDRYLEDYFECTL